MLVPERQPCHSLRGIVRPHAILHARGMDDIIDLTDFAERYLAVWNEPDPDRRRARIAELWAPGGGQILVDPPEEVRAAADHHQFPVPPLEVYGHEALDARVSRAYDNFIAGGEYRFVAGAEPARLLPHVVSLPWAMVTVAGGEHAGGGVNVLELDDDGRIRLAYLFMER